MTTVGEGTKDAATVSNVGKHFWVVEHRDSALRVEKDPIGIDVVFVLGQVVGELEEGGASIDGDCRVGECRRAGAERSIVAHGVATETAHVGKKSAVRAGERAGGSGLGKCSAGNNRVARNNGRGGARTLFVSWRLVVVKEALGRRQIIRIFVPTK